MALFIASAVSAANAAPKAREAARARAPSTPPPTAAVVRWPAVLPCAHPRWLQLWGKFGGNLVWSSADGSQSVSFATDRLETPIPLRGDFPAGRLERLWNSSEPMLPSGLSLDCSRIPEASDNHSVNWQLASDGHYEVSASYAIPRVPRARRLERWVTPTDPANLLSDPDAGSLFQRKLAGRGRGNAELERPSTELARDLAADLRDFLRAACARGRCGAWLRNADSSLATLLRATSTAYQRIDRDLAKVEPFGHGYQWKVSCEGSRVELRCSDPNYQVLCSMTLDVGPGSKLVYDAFRGELALDAPPGAIQFDLSSADAKVVLTGSALASNDRP